MKDFFKISFLIIVFFVLFMASSISLQLYNNNLIVKKLNECQSIVNEKSSEIIELTQEVRYCEKKLQQVLDEPSDKPLFTAVTSQKDKLINEDHSCVDCGYWKEEPEIKFNNHCYKAYIYQKNATIQTLPILKSQWLKQGNDWLYKYCKLCNEEIWCAVNN